MVILEDAGWSLEGATGGFWIAGHAPWLLDWDFGDMSIRSFCEMPLLTCVLFL